MLEALMPTRNLFVAMPFKKEYEPVFKMIQKAAALTNISVRRVDREPFNGSIISYIRNTIEESDYMVAVASEENGNVYYEIGLAHCQKKPVIILTSDPKTLKFDLRDHRSIVYDSKNPSKTTDELVKHLSLLLGAQTDPTTHLAVSLGSSAHSPKAAYERGLEKAKQTIIAEANLHEPVEVTRIEFREKSGDIAIEVRDFFGDSARAIVDVNGIIRVLRRVNN
jgi:hypothetical protein